MIEVLTMVNPAVHGRLGVGDELVAVSAADVAIDRHPRTDRPPEQLVDRHTQQFALYIP